MGCNGGKQIEEKKIHPTNPEYEIPHESPRQKPRHDQLEDPSTDRPIELQQNNHNRMSNHIHHDEHRRRIPLAINRWHKPDDQILEEKSKSFIEEYVHQ